MKRPLLVGIVVAALAAAGMLAWNVASRDRQYRRLIAAGDGALSGGQTLLAIESFSGAIALKPDSMLGYLRRGETYRQRGDLDAALRDLRKASVLDRGATRPLEQLGDAFYAQGQFGRAADQYEAYLRLDDRSPRLLYKLGLARYAQGRAQAAIPALRRAVELNDRFAEGYYMLGVCLAADQQHTEALWAQQRAVRLAPALAPAREALADLFGRLSRESDRIEQLEALAALEPDRADRSIALAMARVETGRVSQAVLVLGRAAERRPNDTSIDRALATVWLRVADTDDDPAVIQKALEATRKLVAAGRPTGADLLLHGRALLRVGDPAAALPVLREAAASVPVDPDAYDLLAVAAERGEAWPEAKWALERLVALPRDDRSQALAYARIAALALRLQQPAEAVQWLDRAIGAAPSDLTLLPRLAEAQLAAGTPDVASETVKRALAVGVDTPLLHQVSAKLPSAMRQHDRP